MIGLLKKDMAIVSCNARVYVVVIAFGILYSLFTAKSGVPSNFFSVYLIMVLSFAGIGTISYDDMGGGMGFLLTLPVKKSTYVREKYLFCMLCAFAGWVISAAVGVILYRGELGAMISGDESFFLSTLMFAAAAGILIALMIPLRLRFGSENSRVIILGICAAAAAFLFAAMRLLSYISIDGVDVLLWLQGLSGVQLLTAFLVFLILEFLVSYFCSLRIMRKKEF